MASTPIRQAPGYGYVLGTLAQMRGTVARLLGRRLFSGT